MSQRNFGVPNRRASTNVASEPSFPSASFLGSRTFILSCCIVAAVLADLGALAGAGVLAEQFRFGLQSADNPKLVYLVLPFYLPFAWALGSYKVEILRSLARSGARAGASLGISFGVVILVVFALKAGTNTGRR